MTRVWAKVVLTAVLIAAGIVAALPAWSDIWFQAMRSEEQSHIWLAVPVAVWLGYIRRRRLRKASRDLAWLGPVGAVACVALARFGYAAGFDLFWHMGAIGLVLCAGLSVWGWTPLWRLGPAVGALGFLLPVPGRIRLAIAQPLQEASAQITQALLELLGFAVTRNGNVLNLNGEEIAVAEACNGMRMVSALLLVSYAFVFSSSMRWGGRLMILAISPAIALIINTVRLVVATLLYGYADHDVASGLHDLSGWLSLPLAMGLFWLVFVLMRWLDLPIAQAPVWDDRLGRAAAHGA